MPFWGVDGRRDGGVAYLYQDGKGISGRTCAVLLSLRR
jgi:hypothetical protein